jgi:hypothetical protein
MWMGVRLLLNSPTVSFRCGAKISDLLRRGVIGKKVENVTVDISW